MHVTNVRGLTRWKVSFVANALSCVNVLVGADFGWFGVVWGWIHVCSGFWNFLILSTRCVKIKFVLVVEVYVM